ncbi:MAG TPA: Npt1/Npt2 family nucleotide transporter [Candidatus Babeliales bacterium]|nr:Npt1/Npt2 family nucleotide transporter [Candidatus Babeliales bacterium]
MSGLFGDRQERLKLLLLTAAFFLVIAAYTVIQALKDSVFLAIVGEDWQQWARMGTMFVLVPAILLYSYLVDRMRRYELLYVYTIAYGILGLTFAYFLGDPQIGLANTVASPNRLIGWCFFFFSEGYSSFIVSLFWAFANSVNSPESAKKSYGFLVSGSKLGGALSAGLAWYLFSCSLPRLVVLSDVGKHQLLIGLSSIMLLLVPVVIHYLMKKVPGRLLHGYEAVYQIEKERAQQTEEEKPKLFRGLQLLVKYPYVMGIFGMIFFYEVCYSIVSYQRLIIANACSTGVAELSCKLFEQMFWIHVSGFLISSIGTTFFLERFGERRVLLLIPIVSGSFLLWFVLTRDFNVTTIVFVCLRAINFAVTYPVRESLYIPTVKDVKFKSKSWIDAFGNKLSKTFGSSTNLALKYILNNFDSLCYFWTLFSVFGVLIAGWVLVAHLLGKRYERLVTHNEVIGL